MFDYSLKKQSINPKKIYAIDLGLVAVNVSKVKGDEGHKLENMVYNALRLKFKEIYYHKGNGECDFIVIEKGAIKQVIQVCFELNVDNRTREFNGFMDALKTYKWKEGDIMTCHQEDFFQVEDYVIKVIPSYKFLSSVLP